MVVVIQKTGRNTENLIESTRFDLKISRATCFFRILVEFACFAITILRN